MAKKHTPKYQSKDSSSPILAVLLLVMLLFVGLALGLRFILNSDSDPVETAPTEAVQETQPAEKKPSLLERLFGAKETEPPTEPEPEHVISQATISVTGDILMHMPVINTGLQTDGSYNFDSIFQYLKLYTRDCDLAVANLETTLCGTDGGFKYSGYPAFNCPDEIVDALKNAGFDVLLTANNHCYDTSEYGFLRTVRTVRERGLTALGTMEETTDPKYIIQDLNGIRVGMVCYTYEGPPANPLPGVTYMNWNAMSDTCAPLINSFLPTQMDPFYLEVREILEQMKQNGADTTLFFIHWGEEYKLTPTEEQQTIAQQLCDIGYDVIVGGHPHVIQPVSLLTSRVNPDHKTVCLYSTGNAVSNQRIKEMDLKTGHTEDALLFTLTYSKYSDGTVYLEDAQILPCWVDVREVPQREYVIIPLHPGVRDQWTSLYGMDAASYENAIKSYDRTTEMTNPGLYEVKGYLSVEAARREENYLAAVTNPA